MSESLVQDVLIVLAAGAISGVLTRLLQMPVLVGYLLVGILLGDGVFGWVGDQDHQLDHVAETGVFLLLFTIGLEFSLSDFRRLGITILLGGAAQMALVAVPVTGLAWAFGMNPPLAVLVGLATSFSSTVLVFRGLAELGLSSSPAGKRAIAILLFQDAALVPLLLLIPLAIGLSVGQSSAEPPDPWILLTLAVKSLVFLLGVFAIRYLLARWWIPMLAAYRSPQLIVLVTVVLLGSLALGAFRLGLPPAVGAFAAGFAVNGNRWTEQIDSLMLPFRELFSAVFFVSLGLLFDPALLFDHPLWLLAGLLGIALVKTVAAWIALRLTGLANLASLQMAAGLAHVGEFAFVVMLQTHDAGGISEPLYEGFVTISVCTLVVTPFVLQWAGHRLQAADPSAADRMEAELAAAPPPQRTIVIGAGPIGRRIASVLETLGRDVCVVDLSPINLHPFSVAGIPTVSGDASQPSTLRNAGIAQADTVIVVVPDDDQALKIVRESLALNDQVQVVVRCRYQSNQRRLLAAGCRAVISEEVLAAESLTNVVQRLAEPSENR